MSRDLLVDSMKLSQCLVGHLVLHESLEAVSFVCFDLRSGQGIEQVKTDQMNQDQTLLCTFSRALRWEHSHAGRERLSL